MKPGRLLIEDDDRSDIIEFDITSPSSGVLRGAPSFIADAFNASRQGRPVTILPDAGRVMAVRIQRHEQDGSAVFNLISDR